MKIQKFYRTNRCEHIADYENLLFEEGRYTILHKAIQLFATLMGSHMAKDTILYQINNYLQQEYLSLNLPFSWQKTIYAKDDTLKFRRLLLHLNNVEVAKSNVPISFKVPVALPDNSDTLEGLVHLILQDNHGIYHAMIIHSGTCHRTMKSRSIDTAAAMDLNCLVAKINLEKFYPNIQIHSVYLTHKNDTLDKVLRNLEISDSTTSNMHTLSYQGYYNNGVLNESAIADAIKQSLVKSKKNCYECSYASLCKTPPINVEQKNVMTAPPSMYRIPDYTADQMNVVRHKEGPLLVCAGPGSGKTATIIGRIRYLVEECGITPQFLLVVTFTNKAAQELKERCLSFLDEWQLPKIATLHAFAYQILREHQELLEKDLKLLTNVEQFKIIQNIVSVIPPLTGFTYGQEYGNRGLYKTLAKTLNQYFAMSEYEFFSKNPNVGRDFIGFAKMYKEIIECNDYITFDEQISLTNKLFDENPDVLHVYQQLYQYVMVDEYQDVNAAQVKMLYAIAKHGNIVVVGDDDQSIYGFRGASADFMLQFTRIYPTAKTVVLKDNFRSTKSLVNAAQALIHNNHHRISKDIRSGSHIEGVQPMVINSLDSSVIDSLIDDLLKRGYHYDNIAILSTKNAPLEDLHNTLKAPSVLAKSYLRYDGLFTFAHSVLKLYYSKMSDDTAFLQYAELFKKRHLLSKEQGLGLYDSMLSKYGYDDLRTCSGRYPADDGIFSRELGMLQDTFSLLENTPDIQTFLKMCVFQSNWNSSDAQDVILEQVNKQGIYDIRELLTFMDNLLSFEDEARVDVNTTGKVILSTCHDAKGKEFPVVIIRNDYSSNDEEVRRVFYVAVTRAKEQLYILQDKSCKTDFLKELPHVDINSKKGE